MKKLWSLHNTRAEMDAFLKAAELKKILFFIAD